VARFNAFSLFPWLSKGNRVGGDGSFGVIEVREGFRWRINEGSGREVFRSMNCAKRASWLVGSPSVFEVLSS
jgi:hypothetical protein